jgi:hypothetical protein
MSKWLRSVVLASIVCLLSVGLALAQSEAELKLGLNRDFGFGGFGEIQGLFTMKVSGTDDLVRVDFRMDDVFIGEVIEPPFRLQFHTDNFAPGPHTLSAVGYTSSGAELRSTEIRPQFLSKEAAGKATTKVIVPVVVLVVAITLAGTVGTLLASRRQGAVPLGQPRTYGMAGGTICSRCGRPYALSTLGMNLGVGKLAVCPHCGKWAVARAMPLDALRAAEAAEKARGEGVPLVEGPGAEETLRKAIEESRYQDQ